MNPRLFPLVLLIIASLVLIPACDKKTTEPTNDPAKAAEKVDQANQILIPRIILLVNSGGTDTSAFNVSSAASLYQEALAADPSNGDAHFGLALIDIISLGAEPELGNLAGGMNSLTPDVFRSMIRGDASASSVLADMSGALRTRIKGLARQQVETALGKTTPSLVPGRVAGTADHQLPSFYQDIVENVILPHLTSAVNHLIAVTQIPGYAFLITPQMTGGNTTETYRIDHTEIYLLLALLQGVTAEASVLVSYNVDYVSTDSAFVAQAWAVTGPLLAFRPNGATRMQNARTNLVGMASSIQGSLNHLMTEPPNPEVDLINYNPSDQQIFQEVIAGLDTVKMALSGPYTFDNGPTVNLKNFFDNAIPNYKAKVPPYTVSDVIPGSNPGTYDAVLTWDATTFETWIFPDPTLNGLFPGMTDAELKALFEISGTGWTQQVVIEG